jgi:3-(3-hydroxy-phenyl)propionate hydroxylase
MSTQNNGLPEFVPVVVVGAGPAGIAAATLLGQYGVETLVLDRHETVYPLPRAVHADDEVFRILARLGVGEEFAAHSRPGHGLRLIDPQMRVLSEIPRSTEISAAHGQQDRLQPAGPQEPVRRACSDEGRPACGLPLVDRH